MKILITGGAGFVGNSLATAFKEKYSSKFEITVIDNLKRRGSEMNLAAQKKKGIHFFHGDVRKISDLTDLNQKFDLLIEASAEPSVHAGTDGNPDYLLETNLFGAQNCLEYARKNCGGLLFLSTSRVYSIEPLQNLSLIEGQNRLDVSPSTALPGLSFEGIGENFETARARSLYGTSKLSAELLCQEYSFNFSFPTLINRCGVIAGPGQFGKVDQGVFTLWLLRHLFKQKLSYNGYGGLGKQVRDLLHPQDLFELIDRQIQNPEKWNAEIFNAGGGRQGSTSLLEFTQICEKLTGNSITIDSRNEFSKVDVPWYITDNNKVSARYDWRPKASAEKIATDIFNWAKTHEAVLREFFSV